MTRTLDEILESEKPEVVETAKAQAEKILAGLRDTEKHGVDQLATGDEQGPKKI